jgi:catecholate siderophore receptor
VNYEAGAQWDFAGGYSLRGALFRNEKTNARMTDPVTGNTVLEGKRRVDGVEAQFYGHPTPRWDITAAAAWMTGEIVEGPANIVGKRPLEVPAFSGSLWSIYRFAGAWEAGGGAFWSSEKYLDDQNRGKLPEYYRIDATVAYVQPRYELRLNLFNVFEEEYYYGGYQNSPNRVLPGQPRELQLTLVYRL